MSGPKNTYRVKITGGPNMHINAYTEEEAKSRYAFQLKLAEDDDYDAATFSINGLTITAEPVIIDGQVVTKELFNDNP